MAKKSIKKKLEIEIEVEPLSGSMPNPPHRLDQAKSRNQMLETYSTIEKKKDWHDTRMFENVESAFSSFYGGLDPRRKSEVADGGMVKEDRNAMCNLSSRFVHREYPRTNFYSSPYMDDVVKGPPEESGSY